MMAPLRATRSRGRDERLAIGIGPRKAGEEGKAFVLPGALDAGKDDGHAGPDHAGQGHDHGPDTTATATASRHRQRGTVMAAPAMSMTTPQTGASAGIRPARASLVIFTALLLGAAWIIEYLAPEIGNWAFVAACLIGVAPVAQRAFAALRMGQPFTIESLMTIAAIGALFIGAAEEAALVVFLFAVGEVLEGVAARQGARRHPGAGQSGARRPRNWSPATRRARLPADTPVHRPDRAGAPRRPHSGRWRDRRGHLGRR